MKLSKKQFRTLEFLNNEVWATYGSLKLFFNNDLSNLRRHLDSLEKNKLIKINQYHFGGDRRFVSICYLTQKGASLISEVDVYKDFRIFNTKNISNSCFFHSEDSQKIHAMGLLNNFQNWKRGDLLKRERGFHYPDAVARFNDKKLCIEIERTIKAYKRYVGIFGQYIKMLSEEKTDYIIYTSCEDVVVNKLKAIFFSINRFEFGGQRFFCPKDLRNRFIFLKYDCFVKGVKQI